MPKHSVMRLASAYSVHKMEMRVRNSQTPVPSSRVRRDLKQPQSCHEALCKYQIFLSTKIQLNTLTGKYIPCHFILYFVQHLSTQIKLSSGRQIEGEHTRVQTYICRVFVSLFMARSELKHAGDNIQ